MRIFLDMDGLLADLFSAVSFKLFNKQYNQLTPEEKTEAKKIWYDKEHFVENFGEVETFFANLPPYGPNGDYTNAIVSTVIEHFGEYRICSHPAGIDKEGCKKGKFHWIQTHLNPQPVEILFPQSKAIYATTNGEPNILVDDFPPYIDAWRKAGGIAIEMRTDTFNSAEEVKSFLNKELEAAKTQTETKESFDKIYENFLLKFSL